MTYVLTNLQEQSLEPCDCPQVNTCFGQDLVVINVEKTLCKGIRAERLLIQTETRWICGWCFPKKPVLLDGQTSIAPLPNQWIQREAGSECQMSVRGQYVNIQLCYVPVKRRGIISAYEGNELETREKEEGSRSWRILINQLPRLVPDSSKV